MINAYVVRDPQGRVIGLSVVSYRNALDDVWANDDAAGGTMPNKAAYAGGGMWFIVYQAEYLWMSKQTGVFPFGRFGMMCKLASATQAETWVAQIDGYTLKREQVAL
jgi:hypothetical protein